MCSNEPNQCKRSELVEQKANPLIKASARYGSMTVLRASIQAVPVVGGAMDTMLAGLGAKWQEERIISYLGFLEDRLMHLEKFQDLPDIEPSEPLYDFIMQVFDNVARTRSKYKQQCFANLVARQICINADWEDAEAANRLLKDLSKRHIEILLTISDVKVCGSPFENLQVVAFPEGLKSKNFEAPPTDLTKLFPTIPIQFLRMMCSELIAMGLLHDEGIGRHATRSMHFFVLTETAHWFLKWISED